MIRAVFVLPLAALALSGCGSNTADKNGDDGRKAGGEVLGGSISDDMIPLDSLTSQSPPMKHQPAAAPTPGEAASTDAPAEGAEAAAEPAAETPPAPEEPAAE